MEPPSHGTNAGVGPYSHSHHKGDELFVSAAVSGSAVVECGVLPQHFDHRINFAVVALLLLQRPLPAGFLLMVKNNKNSLIFHSAAQL